MHIIDGHCDSILRCFNEKISFYSGDTPLQLDYNKLCEADIVIQYFALFIESKYKPHLVLEQAINLILYFQKNVISENSISLITTKKHLSFLGKKHLALLAIEGGEVIGNNLNFLEILFQLGIRSIGLTWNERNALANGCLDTDLGLSMLGKQTVKRMNELGMVIDCAHLAPRGLTEVLELSEKPIVISHANCNRIHNHPRNVSDENLKLLTDNKGVIGITFVPYFLANNNASLDDVIKHIVHAVEIAGIDHVGIGSDFDGCDELPLGLTDASCLPNIVDALYRYGFKRKEISKIMYENQLRVLEKNLPS